MILVNGSPIEEAGIVDLRKQDVETFKAESSVVRQIYITGKDLSSFSGNNLPNLEILWLTNNQIVDFCDNYLPSLKHVYFNSNPMTEVCRNTFGNSELSFETTFVNLFCDNDCPDLEHLSLFHNELVDMSGNRLPKLKTLMVACNPGLKAIDRDLPSIEKIFLHGTQVPEERPE